MFAKLLKARSGGWIVGGIIIIVLFAPFSPFSSRFPWFTPAYWDVNGGTIMGAFMVLGAALVSIVSVVLDRRDTRKAARRHREAELQRELERQQLELERHKEQQRAYRQTMVARCDQSIRIFELLPKHVKLAERLLDQAEVELAEGAADPFWDSIEGAVRGLGDLNKGIHLINEGSLQYTKVVKLYKAEPPKFPLSPHSVAKLAVGTATSDRMNAIVRNARRNTDFAMLYHTRKTNEILVAGFTNLAQALDHMTSRITTSIDDLASSVDVMGSTLNESMRAIHSRMDEAAEASAEHRKTVAREASVSADREEKVVKMLDNLQRGRKPSAWDA